MKYDVKYHVNLEEMVDAFIERLNKNCEEVGIKKVYEVVIKKGTFKSDTTVGDSSKTTQPFKTIVFSVVNLENRDKIVLYSTDYRVSNPAQWLSTPWRKKMYGEVLFNCLLGYGALAEQQLLAERLRSSPVKDKGGVEESKPVESEQKIARDDLSAVDEALDEMEKEAGEKLERKHPLVVSDNGEEVHLNEEDYQAWLKENDIVEGEAKLEDGPKQVLPLQGIRAEDIGLKGKPMEIVMTESWQPTEAESKKIEYDVTEEKMMETVEKVFKENPMPVYVTGPAGHKAINEAMKVEANKRYGTDGEERN